MSPLLSDEGVARALADIEWERDGDAITRELRVKDFAAAMNFVNRVAEAREGGRPPSGHPRAWLDHVRLTLSTTPRAASRAPTSTSRGPSTG
jgi:pterin-4a-carbinolamine dehydratase